jgi:hypothetical protein
VHFSFKALILRAQSARKMSVLSPFLRVERVVAASLKKGGSCADLEGEKLLKNQHLA